MRVAAVLLVVAAVALCTVDARSLTSNDYQSMFSAFVKNIIKNILMMNSLIVLLSSKITLIILDYTILKILPILWLLMNMLI